jgi:hypothetical protein
MMVCYWCASRSAPEPRKNTHTEQIPLGQCLRVLEARILAQDSSHSLPLAHKVVTLASANRRFERVKLNLDESAAAMFICFLCDGRFKNESLFVFLVDRFWTRSPYDITSLAKTSPTNVPNVYESPASLKHKTPTLTTK